MSKFSFLLWCNGFTYRWSFSWCIDGPPNIVVGAEAASPIKTVGGVPPINPPGASWISPPWAYTLASSRMQGRPFDFCVASTGVLLAMVVSCCVILCTISSLGGNGVGHRARPNDLKDWTSPPPIWSYVGSNMGKSSFEPMALCFKLVWPYVGTADIFKPNQTSKTAPHP